MSTLMDDSVTLDDLEGGRGKPLPTGVRYKGTFLEAKVEDHPKGNGRQARLQLGNITTAAGETEFAQNGAGTYRIGGRKVFVDEWVQHTSAQAQQIGHQNLKRIAVATGLVPRPEKGEKVVLPTQDPEELASLFVGRSAEFEVKHERQLNADKTPKFEDDGVTPKVRVVVARWF